MNSIKFKIINSIFILIIFVSWIKIASLNWIVPEYVRTLQLIDRYTMEELFPQLNNMSRSYILTNFIPFFVLFFISVIIFFITNIKNREINYLETNLMKIIFSAIIFSSSVFILVFNIPLSIGFLSPIQDFNPIGSETNWPLIEFYFNCLAVISFILICISTIGLFSLGKLNRKSKIDLILKSYPPPH